MNLSIVRYILGWVLTLESIFMLLPSLIGLIYQERSGWAFLMIAVICFTLGMLIKFKKPKNQMYFAREGFVTVSLSWLVMSIIGAIPFVISGEIPSFTDALFETISGFTTTGASILTDVETLSHACLFWRSFTHWIGGMGVFVFLLAVLPMAGGYNMNLMRAESPGPSVSKLVPKARETAKILYIIYFVMTITEVIALLIAGMPVFDAFTISFGTAGTGGFGILNSSIGGYNAAIQWIVTIFMILFGVNFNAYYLMLGKNRKDVWKMEEVKWYFGIIIVAILVIMFNIRELSGSYTKALRDAAFQVGSIITTTGYSTTDFNLWPAFSQTVIVFLMFVGACAGSTGGGVKVSRILILLKSVKQEIGYLIHPRSVKVIEMDGKALDKSVVRSVSIFLVTYVLIFGGSLLVLSLNEYGFTTNFTAVLAAMNNIGPGLELVGPTGNFGFFSVLSKYVLMFDMLAGRLELYPVLLLITPSVWKKN